MTAILAALVVLEALGLMWQASPADGYRPRHLVGCNPAADDLRRAVTAKRRALRNDIAPWSHHHQTPRRT